MVHEADHVECRECGSRFDLSVQPYYDNCCPSCMEEEAPERLKRWCARCNERYERGEGESVTIVSMTGERAHVGVCSEACKNKMKHRHRPEP